MAEFKSWRSYWIFEEAVQHRSRYVLDPEIQDFLETVAATSRSRAKSIPEGSTLWRAQEGCGETVTRHTDKEEDEYDETDPRPFPPDRMKPPTHTAREGRANPQGIPYLYLATKRETAMAEVRPWIGSYISVAQFKVLRSLKIVDCAIQHKDNGFLLNLYFEAVEPPPDNREQSVWYYIDEAFARPVDRNDDTADYAPTQIIAELFKAKGFDGVAYRSSLGEGHNVVLFDPSVAKLLNCSLFVASSVKFNFDQRTSPYFVQDS